MTEETGNNEMLTFAARSAMSDVIKGAFSDNYGIVLNEDDIDFGFNVSMKLIKRGMDMNIEFNDYDNFHALLIKEAVCALILSKKLREILESVEEE